ncbi:hypothetical protein BDQ17DRAFT_1174556, partial [Cyathus striatus]
AFKSLMTKLNVPQVQISPYNKHANGVVERGHFTLRQALLKSCAGQLSKWPEYLGAAAFADQISISRVTGFSPFQLLHATDPILPFDLVEATFLVEGFRKGMSTTDLLALRIQQLMKHEKDIVKASDTLQKSRFKSKEQFERRFRRKLLRDEYDSGELVLVQNTQYEMQLDKKNYARYCGPYEVIKKTLGGAYKVQELDGSVVYSPIAAFRVIPYIHRDHWFMKDNKYKHVNITDSDSGSQDSDSDTD